MSGLVSYSGGVAIVNSTTYRATLHNEMRRPITQRVAGGDGPPDDSPFDRIPIGAWRVESEAGSPYGRRVQELKLLSPRDLLLTEDLRARSADVARYARWMQQGHRPPPVEVLQDWDGRLRVSDGHRRTLAAMQARKQIRAWVAWVVQLPELDADGQPTYTALTWELSEQLGRLPGRTRRPL